ncbi:MAG TPA: quaternary ammonium compound efflux SMR transporter SugE [Gammaproteobacteria bacterium]
MAWFYLVVAGLLECAWAVGLKLSNGFTRLWPSVFTIVAMVASFRLLALAMRSIPVGTAYAVWTGIGAVGVAALGMAFFDESRDALRIASIALIVMGIAGLRLFGAQGS